MFAEQLSQAIGAARTVAMLDNVSRLTWRGLSEGLIDDDDATRLSVAIEAGRAALKAKGQVKAPSPAISRPRPCRSTDKARSLSRRRQLAMSGAMPGNIAHAFTMGEIAALSVIARECQRRGRCTWFMDKIAAVAGVSRTTARNALRQAQALGLVTVEERRHQGARSDSNVIQIVSREWQAWLRLEGGGCKNAKPTSTEYKSKGESAPKKPVISGRKRSESLYSAHGKHRRRN
jgi:hypothetical protein